jgi:hypothetical protein
VASSLSHVRRLKHACADGRRRPCGAGDEHDSLARLQGIDARSAECFKAEDRDRLLAVIEASFGTTDAFNRAVVRVLRSAETNRCRRATYAASPAADETVCVSNYV